MRENLRKAGMSFAVVAILVIASLAILGAAPAMGADEGSAAKTPAREKVDPELLRSMAAGEGSFEVYVLVSDKDSANEYLASNGLPTVKGKVIDGVPTVGWMQLSADEIMKAAESDSVVEIVAFVAPQLEAVDERLIGEEIVADALPQVDDYDVDVVQGAVEAWDLGYTGEGVKIAIIDTGFDMAHPDLQGQQARYEDPDSPYYGWPIGYDDFSAMMLADGETKGWMADTSTVVRARGQSLWFDGAKYRIKGLMDADGDSVRSLSGMYHIGYHPDPALAALMGGPVAVLVVDASEAGVYDTVYVDVMRDLNFANDKPCTKGDEISYFDCYDPSTGKIDSSAWDAGDGFADYSGGMIYWIADGENVYPGSDWLWDATEAPEMGSVVAFMGEVIGDSHGTMTSSAALAVGRTMGGQLGGMAPGAKLICIPFTGSTVNAWLFAALGADGVDETGDEANLISNSYGYSADCIDGGYNFYDMMAMSISGVCSGLWCWSTGNGGPGYGTPPPIVDANAVGVGAGTTMQYRYLLGYEMIPDTQKWGDMAPFSNSGPTRTGKLMAEIVASGMYSVEPAPLNMPDNEGSVGNGARHYQIGSGTSHASPTVAGGAALGYQAFWMASCGEWPASDYAKSTLMAAADDMHFDPFKQGAGWLNAGTFAKLMADAGGTMSILEDDVGYKATLYPGDYGGEAYEAFPNFMLPGDEQVMTVTTYNKDPEEAAEDVAVEAQLLLRTESETLSVVTKNPRDVYFDITDIVPETTDLVKVTMYFPYENLDPLLTYTVPTPVEYWLELHDWIDLDGNGIIGKSTGKWELARYSVDGSDCNANQIMLKDPIERTTDGLIVRVRAISPMMGLQISIQVDSYELENFGWVELRESGDEDWESSLSLDIDPASSKNWEAKIAVPEDVPIGTYGASIYVDDGDRVQCLPIVITVPSTEYEFEFGGESYFDTTYNNELTGVSDRFWRFEVGDWRMFWCMPDEMLSENAHIVTTVEWDEVPTDINIHVLAPFATDAENHPEQAMFDPPNGPGFYEALVVSSDEMYMGAGVFGFKTNTGGPKEVIAAPIGQCINDVGTPAPFAVVTRCPFMSGDAASVTLEGYTKILVVNDYQPKSIELTFELDDAEDGWITGGVEAMFDLTVDEPIEVAGAGDIPVIAEFWPEEEIYQDLLSGSFEDALANAVYTRPIEVVGASTLTVAVNEVSGCSDLDLALWYDANLNGIADDATFWYVGVGGSDESITLANPADGQYLVKVLGYTVEGDPGIFSLAVMRGVAGATIAATGLPDYADTGVTEFEISYTIPAVVGTYQGAATFGFMGANDMFSVEVVINVVE
ncbi:TPA: S8 family serine peptidase [Thermoplasmata archaeon]|nr:S8 family serine peptidase [Thermoplasmata archaeon]